jgi:hypothetical protein
MAQSQRAGVQHRGPQRGVLPADGPGHARLGGAHHLVPDDRLRTRVREAAPQQRHRASAPRRILEAREDVRERHARQLLEARCHEVLRVDRRARRGREEGVLAAEVLHDQRRIDTRIPRDAADGGALETVLGERFLAAARIALSVRWRCSLRDRGASSDRRMAFTLRALTEPRNSSTLVERSAACPVA